MWDRYLVTFWMFVLQHIIEYKWFLLDEHIIKPCTLVPNAGLYLQTEIFLLLQLFKVTFIIKIQQIPAHVERCDGTVHCR